MAPSTYEVPPRKRTVRACDQCRRRKVKCNGKLSCTECDGLGLSCSYGSQFKQSRGPSYVNHLEKKIARLEYELRRASEPAQHFQKVPRDRTPPVNHCALPEGSISSLSPEPQHTFNDWTQNKFQCSSPSPQSEWTFTRTNEPFSKSTSSSLVFGGLGYAEDVAPLTDPSIWNPASFVAGTDGGLPDCVQPSKYYDLLPPETYDVRNPLWNWNALPASNFCNALEHHDAGQTINFLT